MSKLNVDQKTILDLLSDKKSNFLIPDYQRPYAWDEEQCQTFWDDIFLFSFPNNNSDDFNDEEYFLGSIVTYRNEKNGKSEVIDGQQRLTTLMLILRAFYDKFENMQDPNSRKTREFIEKCIWKTDTFGTADKSTLKIDSEVATDNDKEEFLELLRTGKIRPDSKSQYVKNFQFFQKKIDEFSLGFASYFPYFPARLLNNCILLPIEAESQETALRIFSTLNDRGLPLADADIFKAQFYKYYGTFDKKDDFIRDWKELEDITSSVFQSATGTPMDELFARYMYFLRAKEQNKRTTTEALRRFYERNKYQYLKQPNTINELKELALFWQNISNQEKYSDDVLKKLFILKYAPNSMWQNITSVYFLQNKNSDGCLNDEKQFSNFLSKITAFIFTYAITNPGVNALRTPIYDEMINIINGDDVSFSKYRFNETQTRALFDNYEFTNQRTITRSMITWYAHVFPDQKLLDDVKESFELEHIYARKRHEMEGNLRNYTSLESLGNKILLEKSINIRASDYKFDDKRKIYSGERRRGKNRNASNIYEISRLIRRDKFDEDQINERNKVIIDAFFSFLRSEQLIAFSDSSENSFTG